MSQNRSAVNDHAEVSLRSASAKYRDHDREESLPSAQTDFPEVTPAAEFDRDDPHLNPVPPSPAHDRQEFEELLLKYRKKLTLYLFSLVHHVADAEDLCQRCSVVMWRKFSLYDREKSFFSWACGIARLEAMNYRRAKLAKPLVFKTEVLHLLASSIESMERNPETQRLAALQQCLSLLPEQEKSFLRRIYWEGCSLEAIARELGCSPKTFYNRIYLLRRRLLNCVDKRLRAER